MVPVCTQLANLNVLFYKHEDIHLQQPLFEIKAIAVAGEMWNVKVDDTATLPSSDGAD